MTTSDVRNIAEAMGIEQEFYQQLSVNMSGIINNG